MFLRIVVHSHDHRYELAMFPTWTGTGTISGLLGVNPTLLSLGAIRRKDRQMKELSDDLFHPRTALKPCIWRSHALSDPKMKENCRQFSVAILKRRLAWHITDC